MGEGRGIEEDFLPSKTHLKHLNEDGVHPGPVGEHDAFWFSSGSARIIDPHQVFRIDLHLLGFRGVFLNKGCKVQVPFHDRGGIFTDTDKIFHCVQMGYHLLDP